MDSSCVGRVVHTEIEIPPNLPVPTHPHEWYDTTDIRFLIRALVAVEIRFWKSWRIFWGAQEPRINQEESLEIACVGIVCFFFFFFASMEASHYGRIVVSSSSCTSIMIRKTLFRFCLCFLFVAFSSSSSSSSSSSFWFLDFFLRSSFFFFLLMGLWCHSSSSFTDSWISSSDSSFYFLWCVFVDAGAAGSGKVGVQEKAIRTRLPRSTVSSNLLSLTHTRTHTHTNITKLILLLNIWAWLISSQSHQEGNRESFAQRECDSQTQ